MKNLIEGFEKIQSALIQAINDFSGKKRKETLLGKWSLKDIMAHLAGWDIETITCLKKFKEGKTSEWVGTVSRFNEQNVKKRRDWNWSKVYKEFIEKGKELVEEYEAVSEDLWTKRIWSNKSFTPEKFLKIDIRHYNEHLAQIKKLVKTTGD